MPGIDPAQLLIPSINVFSIVLRTFIVYLVVVFGLRLFGKRELGQMTPFDLVLILTLSNAVQNAMTGPDTSLTGGLVAAGTLLVSNWALGRLANRVPRIGKWLTGGATLLIEDGKPIYENMKREEIDEDELEMAAREHGIDKLEDVKKAVLEIDGSISIIGEDNQTHRRRRRRYRRMP